MNKEKRVAFINEKIKATFEELKDGKFEDKELHKLIQNAIEILAQNPERGIKIPKKLWPRVYIQEYKIINLWKYNLPKSWRLIYTIKENEVEIVSIILEWFDHKEYEKRFNY